MSTLWSYRARTIYSRTSHDELKLASESSLTNNVLTTIHYFVCNLCYETHNRSSARTCLDSGSTDVIISRWLANQGTAPFLPFFRFCSANLNRSWSNRGRRDRCWCWSRDRGWRGWRWNKVDRRDRSINKRVRCWGSFGHFAFVSQDNTQ